MQLSCQIKIPSTNDGIFIYLIRLLFFHAFFYSLHSALYKFLRKKYLPAKRTSQNFMPEELVKILKLNFKYSA